RHGLVLFLVVGGLAGDEVDFEGLARQLHARSYVSARFAWDRLASLERLPFIGVIDQLVAQFLTPITSPS
ncbi:MAG: hypothetical protein ACQSGP_13855, partial [Frankia sp.]